MFELDLFKRRRLSLLRPFDRFCPYRVRFVQCHQLIHTVTSHETSSVGGRALGKFHSLESSSVQWQRRNRCLGWLLLSSRLD